MKTSTVEIIKLESAEGKTLTNGDVYSKSVYLGCNDSTENWYEIEDSEVPSIVDEALGEEVTES